MKLWERMLAQLREAGLLAEPPMPYLLAVSGGRDSSVMAHLFAEAGLPFGIAHCNFQLRGEDSEGDARFVAQLAETYGVPFHLAVFDTRAEAAKRSASIQLAARELRYDWLESLRAEQGYGYIATAHHLNDSVETLLHHLARGCGIRGLQGIPLRTGQVVRPLLFAEAEEIAAVQAAEKLPFREDASNAEVDYTRNYIRHRIMPHLLALNPSLLPSMAGNFRRFQEAGYLYEQMAAQVLRQAVIATAPVFQLDSVLLLQYRPALSSLLYEALKGHGLNSSQAVELASAVEEGQSGRLFLTPTHRILTAPGRVEALPLDAGPPPALPLSIEQGTAQVVVGDRQISLAYHLGPPPSLAVPPDTALLDATALVFPLRLRLWQAGDAFQPLGMGGQRQKLQDFFSNNKLSGFDKQQQWLLEDAKGRIAWVVGRRISHEHRIRPGTSAYWKVSVSKH